MHKSLSGRVRTFVCSAGAVVFVGGALASCGGTQTIIKTVQEASGGSGTPASTQGSQSSSSPATPASTSTTPPSTSNGLSNHCSPGVDATQSISCGLASNVFYEYYQATQSGGDATSISAWSPSSKQDYSASCSPGAGLVKCSVSGTTDPNAEVDLTQTALSGYSPQQASLYAAQHDVGPSPSSGTQSTSPVAPQSAQIEGPGSTSHATDPQFCSTHSCITNFPNGNGTIVQCNDGEWSHSGGLSGACSYHGGEH